MHSCTLCLAPWSVETLEQVDRVPRGLAQRSVVEDAHAGPAGAELGDDAGEFVDRTSRAQLGGQQMLAAEHLQRQVAVAVAIAVEEAAFLMPVQRIVGGIEIQHDLLRRGRMGGMGYRRITALLRDAGWTVNRRRVERIWQREGLKVPRRQPKRSRLWLNDGSCLRLRPERANYVWAYDFLEERTRDERKFRMFCVVDEFMREALEIWVARRLISSAVIGVLADLCLMRGTPTHIRSDNGPGFAAIAVKGWIAGVGASTVLIEPGSPWENGYVESFNGKLRDDLLNGEVFNTLMEAQALIEEWRPHDNWVRPHSALNYRPPAAETMPPTRPQIQPGRGQMAATH